MSGLDPIHAHPQSRDTHETLTAHPSAVVQSVKNFFGGGTRAQDTILAIAIVVIVLQAVLLYGAWKDLQTQTWLRSDALSKENSELRAQVMTNNALLQAYGITKSVQTPEK